MTNRNDDKEIEHLENLISQQAEEILNLKKELLEKDEQIYFLNHIVALMPGHVYWKNEKGVYKGCNDTQAKFLGYSSGKEIIGKTDYDFAWYKAATSIQQTDKEVMFTQETITVEETDIINEQEVTFLSKKSPLKDKSCNVIGIVGVSFDISDRKKMEKELREAKEETRFYLEEIIGLMPGHVYWLDKNNVYLGCNNLQARHAGLVSREEIVGKKNVDLPWRDQAEALDALNLKVMQSGEAYTAEEIAYMTNGLGVYLSSKVPLKNRLGEVIGILGVSFDITDRKKIEQELIEAKERAEEANKVKEDFIHNMEHDIRTPFIGVSTMAEILYDEETNIAKKEGLKTIVECSKQLLNYCNEVLNFSRLEFGESQISERKFDLRKLLNDIYAMEKAAAAAKKLAINFNCDLNVPSILIGDRNRLFRVLMNLVGNAIKFTVNGKIEVGVKFIKNKSDKEVIIKFFVEDTGIGIEESKKEFIYEKFTRIYPANKNRYEGMGLGLKIVKQFIHDMDGEIDVRSILNKGTTFVCTLPFKLPLVDEVFEEE